MRTQKILILTVLAVLLNGCGKDDAATETSGHEQPTHLEKISFRLAWVPDMAEVGVFVAKEKGFFRNHGLDVSIDPGGFGLDPIKLVATGSSDYGIGGAGNLLVARSRGVPIVAIGAEFQNTPVGFITRSDSGIESFEDFAGNRVGIQTGADTDVLYRALLVKNEMSQEDVVEVPIQYDMSPFVNDVIDVLPGYITNQPIVLRQMGIENNVISAKSEGTTIYGNVFFTTEERIKNQPEQVRKFMQAVREGWQFALANKDFAIEVMQKQISDFDGTQLAEIYDAVVPFIMPDESGIELLHMSEDRWLLTEEVMLDARLIPKGSTDIKQTFTNSFLQ